MFEEDWKEKVQDGGAWCTTYYCPPIFIPGPNPYRPKVVALIAKTGTLNFITGALPLDSRNNLLTLTLQQPTEAYLEVDFITIKIVSAAGKEAAGPIHLAILDTRKNTICYMETHLGLNEQSTNSD